MDNIEYLEQALLMAKYAKNNGLQNVDKDIWGINDNEILTIKNGIAFENISEDKTFYENVNILLNNFEEKLNRVPDDVIREETIVSEGMVFTPVYISKIVVEICKK